MGIAWPQQRLGLPQTQRIGHHQDRPRADEMRSCTAAGHMIEICSDINLSHSNSYFQKPFHNLDRADPKDIVDCPPTDILFERRNR